MTEAYTRVTVAHGGRNVEMLLPGQVPLGVLLPEVMGRAGADALVPTVRTLTLDGGGSLSWSRSLDEAGVVDGSVLRVTDRADAQPAPVVFDVVDHAAGVGVRRVAWPHGVGRTVAASVLGCVLGWPAANLLTLWFTDAAGSRVLVAAGAVVLLLAAALDNRRVGLALPLVSCGMAAWGEGVFIGAGRGGVPAWSLLAAVVLAVLAWFAGNRQWRHAGLAAAMVVCFAAAWFLPRVLVTRLDEQVALTAVLGSVLLGYLPRLALGLSGVARLDDRALTGEPVLRPAVDHAIDAAHQGLVTGVVAAALTSAAVVRALARGGGLDVALALVVVCLTALRSRSYPLLPERLALQLGAGLGAVSLGTRAVLWQPSLVWLVAGVLLVLAGCGVLGLVLRLPEHVWARLRVWASRAEAILSVALVPVAVGIFGIYQSLATVFQR